MYPFCEVSILKLKLENDDMWVIATVSSGNTAKTYISGTEEDANKERAMRLIENIDRMIKCHDGQIIYEPVYSNFTQIEDIEKYAEENKFYWPLNLLDTTFVSWSCTRVTRSMGEISA